jgi:hypothetical protein
MEIKPDIQEFVRQLELYAKRGMNCPNEVAELLQLAGQSRLINEFEELVFLAKFLVRTQEIMKRIGPAAEGFQKLSTEFQSGVKKSTGILKNLTSKANMETTQEFLKTFINMDTGSMDRLMDLFIDLSWIKNWQIDGKPLPY